MDRQALNRIAPSGTLTHWIGNTGVLSDSHAAFPAVNPSTEEVLCSAPYGSQGDIVSAVEAARYAREEWAGLGPSGRRQLLLKAADNIDQYVEDIAELLVLENGKPLRDARGEVHHASSLLRDYAHLAVHQRSGSQSTASDSLSFQYRTPRGVAACITAWNFPLVLAMENAAPNLAVGNTVVLKPSEKTPIATRSLVEIAFSHLPPGVCNAVVGDGSNSGQPLVEHPGTDVVVFVGSVRTGRNIGRSAGEMLKKPILELGGKDVFIVDDSADVAHAATLATSMKFGNCGQVCTASERFLVHSSVFDRFVDEFRERASMLRVGDGFDPDSDMGPLIDEAQLSTVEEQVQDASHRGAHVLCGGTRLPRKGFFYEPTLLTNVPAKALLMSEETFGPVAAVDSFDLFDEALEKANASAFGLGGIVCTTSTTNAMAAIEGLDAGMVKINGPRGKAPGASSEPYKASGIGHNYGVEFMNELTHQKSIDWKSRIG